MVYWYLQHCYIIALRKKNSFITQPPPRFGRLYGPFGRFLLNDVWSNSILSWSNACWSAWTCYCHIEKILHHLKWCDTTYFNICHPLLINFPLVPHPLNMRPSLPQQNRVFISCLAVQSQGIWFGLWFLYKNLHGKSQGLTSTPTTNQRSRLVAENP